MCSKWAVQDLIKTNLYPFFCIDVFLNLALVFSVLLCNLFIVFVNGVGAEDIVKKVVILNFILDQQLLFKREIFVGKTGALVLRAMKEAFEYGIIKPGGGPQPSEEEIITITEGIEKRNNVVLKKFQMALVFLAYFPIFLAMAFIVYGPMCKPGPTKVGQLDGNLRPGT